MRILAGIEHMRASDGVAVQSFQVTRELAARGHTISVTYLNGGDLEDGYRSFAESVRPISTMQSPITRHMFRPADFAASVRTGIAAKPDIVYDNYLWSLPWSATCAALTRAKVIGHMHGFVPGGPDRPQRILMPRVVRDFVAVSQYSRRQLLSAGVDPRKVHVVHNGISPTEYPLGGMAERTLSRQRLGLRPDAFVALFLGRIDATKGPEMLIEAIRRSKFASGVDLVFVGSGVPDYLSNLGKLGAGLHCHWLPAREDVLTPLFAADALILPAQWDEPFGRVIIEAMATGRPAIATNTGGLPEILTGPFARFLVQRTDVAGLTAAIESVLDWRTETPDLGEQCRQHVLENFTLARMVDDIEARLLEAIRPRRERPRV